MHIDLLSEDMKLAILNKLEFKTISEFRQCNRNSYDFVERFSKILILHKPVEVVDFQPSVGRPTVVRWWEWMPEGCQSFSAGVAEASKRLKNRTVERMKVLGSEGLVDFCRESGVSVQDLHISDLFSLSILPEVLAMLQPYHLSLVSSHDAIIDEWNELNITTRIPSLHILRSTSSYETSARPRRMGWGWIPLQVTVPLGVEKLLIEGYSTCEKSLNEAFKSWLRGDQKIVEYSLRSNCDHEALFEFIRHTSVSTESTIIRRDNGEILNVTFRRGSTFVQGPVYAPNNC